MKNNVIGLVHNRGPAVDIQSAKWAYTTRRIDRRGPFAIVKGALLPKVGDVVLAKILKIGQHKNLELACGRRASLFEGDMVVIAYANRYAPDQFEAIVPGSLKRCDLVAAGGVASRVVFKHEAMKSPTTLEPIGLVADQKGKIVNLADFALLPQDAVRHRKPVIAVVGSSMNAGKTTTAAFLIHGLMRMGYRVDAGKVTGTGSGGDVWRMRDAGARNVLDFVDTGYPSTYLLPMDAIEQSFVTLLGHLEQPDTDYIVIEVADGLYQVETASLVKSEIFRRYVDCVIYAAGDALGAVHGVGLLQRWGVPVAAVSGAITRSPLGMREIQDGINLPVLTRQAMKSEVIGEYLNQWLYQADSAMSGGGANP